MQANTATPRKQTRDHLPDLLQPDFALPPEPTVTDTPERALWRAILDDALHRLLDIRPRKSDADRRMYRDRSKEAAQERDWFASDDTTHPVSFINLCNYLGYDPAVIRRLIATAPVAGRKDKIRDRRTYMANYRRRERAPRIEPLANTRRNEAS